MFKKSVALTLVALSLSTASSFAALTSYSSKIDIDDWTKSSYDVPYSAKTKSSLGTAQTNACVYFKGSLFETCEGGTTSASGTAEGDSDINGRWSVRGIHADSRSDDEESTDEVYYRRSDWAVSLVALEQAKQSGDKALVAEIEQEEENIQKFRSEVVKTIASETDLDMSQLREITTLEVKDIDRDLYRQMNKIFINQEPGDTMPNLLVNESTDKLYVVYKKKNGTSVVSEFSLKDGKWEAKKQQTEKGKQIKFPDKK